MILAIRIHQPLGAFPTHCLHQKLSNKNNKAVKMGLKSMVVNETATVLPQNIWAKILVQKS